MKNNEPSAGHNSIRFEPPRPTPRQIVVILSAIVALILILGTVFQIETGGADVVIAPEGFVRITDPSAGFPLSGTEQTMKAPA